MEYPALIADVQDKIWAGVDAHKEAHQLSTVVDKCKEVFGDDSFASEFTDTSTLLSQQQVEAAHQANLLRQMAWVNNWQMPIFSMWREQPSPSEQKQAHERMLAGSNPCNPIVPEFPEAGSRVLVAQPIIFKPLTSDPILCKFCGMQLPALSNESTEFICPACYAPCVPLERLNKEQIREQLNGVTTQALDALNISVTYKGTGYHARGGDVERKNVIHLYKRCEKLGFTGIADRFSRDEIFRGHQLKSKYQGRTRTLEVCKEMDAMVRSSNSKAVGGAGANAPESHMHWTERDFQHGAAPKANDMSTPEERGKTHPMRTDLATQNLIKTHAFLNRPEVATDAKCEYCDQLLSFCKLEKNSQTRCCKCGAFIREYFRYARCLNCNNNFCYKCVRGENLHQRAQQPTISKQRTVPPQQETAAQVDRKRTVSFSSQQETSAVSTFSPPHRATVASSSSSGDVTIKPILKKAKAVPKLVNAKLPPKPPPPPERKSTSASSEAIVPYKATQEEFDAVPKMRSQTINFLGRYCGRMPAEVTLLQ